MHKLNYLFFLLTFFIYSCDEDNKNPSASNSTLTATIDGALWEASTENGAHAPVIATFPNGGIQLEGFAKEANGDSQTLVIMLSEFSGPGTYENNVLATFFKTEGSTEEIFGTNPSAGKNTIIFSKYDESKKLASGTFSCELYDEDKTLIISNGVFEDVRIEI